MIIHIKGHYYFTYYTPLACLYNVHCAADDGLLSYDLSGLKTHEKFYETNDTRISVCKPVEDETSCAPGNAICLKKGNQVLGLGVPVRPPRVKAPGSLVLDYEGGSYCPQDPTRRMNSSIHFRCDPKTYPGAPTLTGSDQGGCHYNYK